MSHATIRAALEKELLLLGLQILVLDLVIVFALSTSLRMMLLKPLRRISDAMQDIAQGEADLTRRLDDSRRDEVGEVAHWFNVFLHRPRRPVSSRRRPAPTRRGRGRTCRRSR